jgi:DNA-binding LacI/PurR family transcriptional regulator
MDNSNLHRLFSPSLTAVHFPMPVLAKLTVDELMEKMAGKTPASHQLNPQLIPGESTGPVPVK